MGAIFSRHVPAQRLPSAAFGRMRFDSPALSQRHTLSQRLSQRIGSATSLRSLKDTTERSPLMIRRHLSKDAVAAVSPASSPSYSDVSSLDYQAQGVSPPFVLWIGPALVCALMYALYNICIKKGSATINPMLGGVLLQLVAAVLGSCLLMVLIVKDGGTEQLNYDGAGIMWAVLAGASVGVAEILSFVVSGMGVQAMQSIPIIIGGSVLFGTILGALVLGEELTCRGWIGVAAIAFGIGLVGTDPSATEAMH